MTALFRRIWRRQLSVPYDDPTRSPNWCWAHNMMYPACQGMH